MFLDSLSYEVIEGEDVLITVAIPNNTILAHDFSVSVAFELDIGELHINDSCSLKYHTIIICIQIMSQLSMFLLFLSFLGHH